MANWFEREQARLTEERDQALYREYWRCVENGRFPPTNETSDAFLAGWFGTYKFAKAKTERRYAADPGLPMILWILGTMLTALTVMGLVLGGSPDDKTRLLGVGVSGLSLIGLGFLANNRVRRKAAEARAKYDEDWSEA